MELYSVIYKDYDGNIQALKAIDLADAKHWAKQAERASASNIVLYIGPARAVADWLVGCPDNLVGKPFKIPPE